MRTIKSTMPLMLAMGLTLTGCAGLSDTQQRTMTGSLGGAAGGAAIGAIAGNAGLGALIGAGAGALGGFAYGKHKESVDRAYQQGRADAARQPQ
ncbi:MAG: glycine zipper domain-containing protein [Methylotetracoccus sp.]|jgi:hypothetical protein|nr:glycine zipper domain-containing protein [Methylotetracoccus sp.]